MKYTKSVLTAIMLSTSLSSFAEAIDIWAWNINVPVLEKAAELYKQDHPDAEINISDIGRLDVYTKVNIGLQANGKGLPDAFLVEDEFFAGFIANWPNAFVDLSALGYDQYANDFPEFKKTLTQADGKFYAMPFDIGPVGIFYRPSFFEKAGIDPASIQTWEDYLEAGKKIKETTGAFMHETRTDDDGFFRTIMRQAGVGYFDMEGNIDFNNPKVIEALTLVDKMNDAGILYTTGKGWDGFVQAIAQSKIIAIPSGAWLVGTIESQAPDTSGDWAVMPLPKDSEGNQSSNLGGSNFTLLASGDNIQETYDFMSFFTANVQNQTTAFQGGLYPSYMPVYNEASFNEGVEFFGGQAIWKDFAETVPGISFINFTMDHSIALDEGTKIVAEVLTTDKEPADILADAAKRLANQTGRKINKY